jgi:single stranded DNA-binding protein
LEALLFPKSRNHQSRPTLGFVGKDPEKRQVRGNGANFTVLSVATQQSWKDSNDEGQSKTERHRVVAFNRLGESIADTLHKGDHVLVDGQLVSSKYERENGKSKEAKAAKFAIFWSVCTNSVRRLSRAEAEAPTAAPNSEAGTETGDAPFAAGYASNVFAKSRTIANPSPIVIGRPHSFASASNTGATLRAARRVLRAARASRFS